MRILITGIGGRLAKLVGAVLAARADTHVIGLGGVAPGFDQIETIAEMPRGHALAEMVQALTPDVVIHLDQPGEEGWDTQRAGQIQLIDMLAACTAARVVRIVLRSSTLVYGASAENPAFLPETMALIPVASPGLQTDYVAIEHAAAEYAARNPDVAVVSLRCAPIIGPGATSPFATYLRRSHPLILRGFDPRIQLLHPDDAVVAFALAALGNARGAFNLAANEPLLLSQAIRLAGQQPTPLPPVAFSGLHLLKPVAGPIRALLPFDPAFLQFACIADTQRAKAELGWDPQHTAAESVQQLINTEN
jgi:UDP-glucose 4-epimerase